jgi:hypothetical protein
MSMLHCVHCVLVTWGCSHHAGVNSSCGGGLVAWGWTHCTGVESSHGGGLMWGCTGCTGVFLSCGGDVAIVVPIHLVAPC